MSKNNTLRILPKVMAVFLAAVLGLAGCGKSPMTPVLQQDELMTSEEANYNTVQVRIGDYEKEATGNAAVIYLLHKNLYWEHSNATFTEYLVKDGQQVKEGDVLMRFHSDENRLQLETLRIQLQRARESFEEQNTERFEKLHAAKVKSEDLKDYDLKIAEINIEKMQASYEQFLYESNRNMRQLEEQIAELEAEAEVDVLVAPFDGVVEDIVRLNEGDQVNKGQWMARLYSTDRMLIKANDTSGKLRYNMDVIIEAGRKDDIKSFSGKVIVAPHIMPSSVYQDLTLIELDGNITQEQLNGNIKFRCISEDIQEILLVERNAIQREDGEEFVYILDGDMIQKRYVETTLNTPEGVWILDGLEEGQTLIID